ncbi:ethanolamine kinase 1-like isoform X2 [Gordionus sp. m RMFG-2023]|uniref:ethanolamine kinase 1-like isoform X2 n=1 Tax=Gordionus sp. m RMFG-2023 TaxID=3053472 RepID=UPI0031FBABBE
MFNIPYIPILIPQNNYKKEFLNLLKYLKPEWLEDSIIFEYFNKGTTNTIISASLQPLSHSAIPTNCNLTPASNPNNNGSQSHNHITNLENQHTQRYSENISQNSVVNQDILLIRIYGHKTEVIIDREKEIENMVAMWSIGCGSELYCTFMNGLCYGYAKGHAISIKTITDPIIYPIIAGKLVRMHFAFPNQPSKPTVKLVPVDIGNYEKSQAILAGNDEKKECVDNSLCFLIVDKFQNNIKKIDKTGEKLLDYPIACYFPTIRKWASLILPLLDEKNIVNRFDYKNNSGKSYVSSIKDCGNKRSLLLSQLPVDPWEEIDYLEKVLLPMNSPIVFCHNDLLLDNIIYDYHKGLETVDYSLFPNSAFRRKWLALYLNEWQKIHHKIDANYTLFPNLDELMNQVDKFILAPHLFWGVWAILQSQVSDKSFDYFAYAKIRLSEYSRLKSDPSILNL